jgi:hypothetical protein
MKVTTHPTTGQNMFTIDTAPTGLQVGEILVSADRRQSSKGPQLSDAERIRRVILPAGFWGPFEVTSSGLRSPHSTALAELLVQSLRRIAGEFLRDYLAEHPMARTVNVSSFLPGPLLAWHTANAASGGSITFTREEVEEWFPSSKLHAVMAAKGPDFVVFMVKRLAALAAKNHGLKTEQEADKLITLLAADAEAADAPQLVLDLVQRLNHISRSLAARKDERALTLDDC